MSMWNADGSLKSQNTSMGRPGRGYDILKWNQTEPADPYGGSNGRRGNDIPYAGAPSERDRNAFARKAKSPMAVAAREGSHIFDPEEPMLSRPQSAYKQRDVAGHGIFDTGSSVYLDDSGSIREAPAQRMALFGGSEAAEMMRHVDGSPIRKLSDRKHKDVVGSKLFQREGPEDHFQSRGTHMSEAKLRDVLGNDIFNRTGEVPAPQGDMRVQHEGRVRDHRGHGLFGTAPGEWPEERVSKRGAGYPQKPELVMQLEEELGRPRARPPSGRHPPGGGRTNVILG